MRFPFPSLPRGWYALGCSDDLPAGAVRPLRRFGRELALFRTESGTLGVLEGHCPHLGAHLGRGRVCGENLVCPFHAIGFDPTGRCGVLPTVYREKPPARLVAGALSTCEVDGFIMAWFDPSGAPPTWRPEGRHDASFRPLRTRSWTVATHPQETGEGSVDLTHLQHVHRYISAAPLGEPRVAGHRFEVDYSIRRRAERGMRAEHFDMVLHIELSALGFSTVLVEMPELGLKHRIWVLATPIDDEHIDYRVAFSMAPVQSPERLHPSLRFLRSEHATRLLEHFAFRAFIEDVELDFPIWENKAYLERPVLLSGDGPVGRYRKWARQFYEADAAASRASPERRANQPGTTTASAPNPPPTPEAQNTAAFGPSDGIRPKT